MLKKLTGAEPLNGDFVLKDRYEPKNRIRAALYLMDQLSALGQKVSLEKYSEEGRNVVMEVPATTDSKEWIVLGAHYDSVKDCPGANDNATGVVLAMEVATHIASLPERKYNLYLVLFDEEERGLIGSKHFAGKLKEQGIKVHSAHTIDQMGWDEDGDRAIELEMPHPDLLKLYRQVAKAEGFDFPIHTTKVTSTDHRAFRQLGYRAIGLTEEYKNNDTTPHYHSATDTFETVNLAYLANTTAYMKKVFEAMMNE